MAQYTDGFSSGWATLIVNISESGTSPETNKGTISYSMYIKKTSSYATSHNSGGASIYLNIGGSRKFTGSSFDIRSLSVGSSKKICSGSFSVTHDANGELSLAVTAGFTSGVKLGNASISKTFTGTTIPRASSIESVTENVLAGGTVNISLARKVDSYTHTVKIAIGNYSLTQQNVGNSTSFEIPLEWCNAIPTTTSGTATVTAITYSGTTQIGSAVSDTFVINVPDTEAFSPTINGIAITEAVAAVTEAFGGRFVQNLSQLNVSIDASGVYGSTIKSYAITLDGVSYVAQAFTSNIINTAGTIEAEVKVTDSRGRIAEQTIEIAIVEYESPTITAMTYTHGTDSTKVTIVGKVSSVEGMNIKQLKLKYRPMSETTYTERMVEVSDWNFTTEVTINNIDPTVTYEFVAELKDKVSPTSTYAVKTGIVVISRYAGGNGVTLFEEATQEGFIVGGGKPTTVNDLTVKGELIVEAGGFGATRLWTNSNPTSEFAGQSVDLNLNDYDAVEIVFKHKNTSNNTFVVKIFKGYSTSVKDFGNASAASYFPYIFSRVVSVSDAGVALAGTVSKIVNGTASATTTDANAYLIPILIYGIKGFNVSEQEASPMTATHDGNGNVTVYGVTATHDGNGNVTIL